MSYEVFEPQAALKPHIHAFWAQEKTPASFNNHTLFPDSYAELIISIGSPCVWELETHEHLEAPRAVLVRLQKTPMHVRALSQFKAVGMHLYAWGIHALIGNVPHSDAPYIVLDESWQNFAAELNWIAQQYGYAKAINCFQQYMMDVYRRSTVDVTPVRTAGELLQAAHGQLGIHDLADQCYISVSQLQRRFKESTGVSPKTYARIVRFEAIRDRLLANPSYPTIRLADEFGYADQAHFIRDFRTFTTQTPREFAAHALYTSATSPAHMR